MQLSAFAAARAKRKFTEVGRCIEAQVANEVQDLSKTQEKPIESVRGDVLLYDDTNEEIESEKNLDPSDLSTPLETKQENTIPETDIFCTWKPTSTNYERVDSRTKRVHLAADETLCLAGEYGLVVETGSVLLYGATLHASNKIYTVFAPSTHDLPVMKCLSAQATAVFGSMDTGMRDLGSLSPMFSRIWPVNGVGNIFGEEVECTSFKYVSHFLRDTCIYIDSLVDDSGII